MHSVLFFPQFPKSGGHATHFGLTESVRPAAGRKLSFVARSSGVCLWGLLWRMRAGEAREKEGPSIDYG